MTHYLLFIYFFVFLPIKSISGQKTLKRNDLYFNFKSIIIDNPVEAYFVNMKYSITIQTHPTKIVNRVFLNEKMGLTGYSKIMAVRYSRLEIPTKPFQILTFNILLHIRTEPKVIVRNICKFLISDFFKKHKSFNCNYYLFFRCHCQFRALVCQTWTAWRSNKLWTACRPLTPCQP